MKEPMIATVALLACGLNFTVGAADRVIDLNDAAVRKALPIRTAISHEVQLAEGQFANGNRALRFHITQSWRGDLPGSLNLDIAPTSRDWSAYDRLVVDVYNDAVGGDTMRVFVAEDEKRLFDGIRALRVPLKDHGHSRVLITFGWPDGFNAKNVGLLRFRMDAPMNADVYIDGFHLLKPGEPVPEVSADFLSKRIQPLEKARKLEREVAMAKARKEFVLACQRQGQGGRHCWVGKATSMEKVMPREPVAVPPANRFTLALARGEYESFQVVVTPSGANLANVSVSVEDLKKDGVAFPASAIKASPVGYLEIKNPAPYKKSRAGWWPDPILDYLSSANIAGEDLQSFWIRFKCPRNQQAGRYSGKVVVKGSDWSETFPLEVRVYDFELSAKSPLPTAITFGPGASRQFADAAQMKLVEEIESDPESPPNAWRRHRREWGSFLADYYITIDSLYHRGPTNGEKAAIHWDVLQQLKHEGRLGLFNLGYWDYPKSTNAADCAEWEASTDKYVGECYRKAKELGLLEHAYIYGCDEISPQYFAQIRHAIEYLHRKYPGVPLFTTAYDHNFGVGTALDRMDWFCPLTPAYCNNYGKLAASRAAGHMVWWYICCGPDTPFANLFVEQDAIEARMLMGAQTAKYRPDGFLYYQVSIWNSRRPISGPNTFTDWNPVSWTTFHGDGSWFCCGPDGAPCATVRMENYRDGLDDYAYVLEYERLTGRTVKIPEALCRSISDYSRRPEALYVWREQLAEAIEAEKRRLAAEASPWRVLPIYGGGFMQNVVIAPSKPNVWYTYVDVGGPYRSDDSGRSWRPLHGNMTMVQRNCHADLVRTLLVDPRDSDRIVIAGGNNFEKVAGVLVSSDGGRSWRQTLHARFYGNSDRRFEGLCLARNPSNPDEILAASDYDGIFRSTDNGETWRSCGAKGYFFTDIRYDLHCKGRVYACGPALSEKMKTAKHYGFHLGRKAGLMVSEDSGATWKLLAEDSPAELIQVAGNAAIVGNFNNDCELRVSRDGGVTWKPYHEGLTVSDGKLDNRGIDKGRFHAFAAGRDFLLAGSETGVLFRRGINDPSWQQIRRESMSLGDPDCEFGHDFILKNQRFDYLASLVIDPVDPTHWIATDWFFIWQSYDSGRNWVATQRGIMQLVSFDMAFDYFNASNIVYGVADMSCFVSSDGGKSYFHPKHPPYPICLAASPKTPGLVYGAGARVWGGIGRSRDGGKTWQWTDSHGLPGPQKLPNPTAFGVAVDPTNDDLYALLCGPCAAGKGGVYRSHDQGSNWEFCSKGLPENQPLFKDSEWGGLAKALVFSKDGSAVLSTIKDHNVYWLDRTSGEWKRSNTRTWNNVVIADPYKPGRFLTSGPKTMESLDGGKTFHPLMSLPGNCWGMAFDAHTPGLLLLRSNEHIYVSKDGGSSCYILPHDYEFPSGSSVAIFVDRRRIFAFTTGSGVWTREL